MTPSRLIRFPFFAWIISAYPVLFLYTHNVNYVTPKEFLICLLGATAIYGALHIAVYLIVRDFLKSAIITTLLIFLLFLYGPIQRLFYFGFLLLRVESAWIDFSIFLLFFLLFVSFTRKIIRRTSESFVVLPKFLNIFSFALTGICIFNLAQEMVDDSRASGSLEKRIERKASEWRVPPEFDRASLPDIYYIILDAYGRDDVFQSIYGFDNSPFLAELEHRGFHVVRGSHSNYDETLLSLPSSMNLNYLDDFLADVDTNSSNRGVLRRLVKGNILFRKLKELGYRIVTISTGFDTTDATNVDERLKDPSMNALFHQILTNLHIPYLRRFVSDTLYDWHRKRIRFGLEELRNPHSTGDKPLFVFDHILCPHPPFVFNADGSPRNTGRDYILSDGDDYGVRTDYRAGYIGQVQYLNKEVLKSVDAILSRSSIPPIIVLQGDHGPGSELFWDNVTKSNVNERMSILNAVLFPDKNYESLPQDLTPVNSFRIIANRYLGANLPLLANKNLFSSDHRPYLFYDVTPRVVGADVRSK